MANAFFSDLLATISERGRTLLRRGDSADAKQDADGLIELCEALLSGRGEASGTAMAREVLDLYQDLDAAGRRTFFEALVRDFGPDREKLAKAIETWRAARRRRRQQAAFRLRAAAAGADPPPQPRAGRHRRSGRDARRSARHDERPQAISPRSTATSSHLLGSWFNRGFLVLRRIDWSTPANILEQIIRYEAVHEIRDWDDLRRRIDPVDRRCYAFFHPAMVDAPLIFVEVALTETIPGAIAPLLAVDRQPVPIERARTAVFYSISNTQRGLGGISFGNFLIKQVVEELRRELPKLDTFVTLSPVPGFMPWLKQDDGRAAVGRGSRAAEAARRSQMVRERTHRDQLRDVLEPLAAHYFLKARNSEGPLIDSVARFHLGNGARLERINWLGDLSPKGLRESAGVMVNYLYRLDDIEKNHEAYANDGEVVASSAVKKLLKSEGRRLLDMRLG